MHVVDGAAICSVANFIPDDSSAVFYRMNQMVFEECRECSEYAGLVDGMYVCFKLRQT